MAETRTFILARAREIQGARAMLSALNEFFYDDLGRAELFITMFYLKYNTGSRELSFASAGHNLPLLWRGGTGKCDRLDAEGLILGIRKEVEFEERKTTLETGDVLLLYTDGVTEAENSEGVFFGEERLCALLEEHHDLHPREVIDQVLQQVRQFTGTRNFNDDVSLVIMRVDG
jgi:serine phosphatase RsbU (regulator of sigma subunit)